jgi:hypothetical protein
MSLNYVGVVVFIALFTATLTAFQAVNSYYGVNLPTQDTSGAAQSAAQCQTTVSTTITTTFTIPGVTTSTATVTQQSTQCNDAIPNLAAVNPTSVSFGSPLGIIQAFLSFGVYIIIPAALVTSLGGEMNIPLAYLALPAALISIIVYYCYFRLISVIFGNRYLESA